MIKVLFVCLGNVCRSPAAEAIMNDYLQKAGLADKIICDSAGTSDGHAGQPADERMRLTAESRGYIISHTAKQVTAFDLIEFDYIIAMDRNNYFDMRHQAVDEEQCKKIHTLCGFCSRYKVMDVPDPYWAGENGFTTVLDILEDGCQGLLRKLRSEFP